MFKNIELSKLMKELSTTFIVGHPQYQAGFMSNPPEWFEKGIGGRSTISGKVVTPQNALQIAAVLSCVRLLSETIASLPLNVYRRGEDGSRAVASDHYLYSVLHDIANPESTAFTLRETLMLHLLLRGEAYAEKIFDGGGRLRQLWVHKSENVQKFRETDTGELLFRVNSLNSSTGRASGTRILSKEQMWYISGLSWNGIDGLSPISLARESLGLSLSQEEFGSRVFNQGAMLRGVLEHPSHLSNEAKDYLGDNWDEKYGGSANAGKTAVLEEGLKFREVSMTNQDAQFLDSRKFTITEIARIFRVPLHMIYFAENQPRANMEQLNIEFVEFSLRPWLVRIEQTALRDLIPARERETIFIEHNVDGLLRGDFKNRMLGYSQGRMGGWMSVNDIRKKENMNPIPDGDRYIEPKNMGLPEENDNEE